MVAGVLGVLNVFIKHGLSDIGTVGKTKSEGSIYNIKVFKELKS